MIFTNFETESFCTKYMILIMMIFFSMDSLNETGGLEETEDFSQSFDEKPEYDKGIEIHKKNILLFKRLFILLEGS